MMPAPGHIFCKMYCMFIKTINMKKLSVVVACAAIMGIQACNDNSPDAIRSANETNEIKQDSAEHNNDSSKTMIAPVSEADSKFAVEAAGGGMLEVQLGELAQQKASSQRVKDFGAMMVRDHTKANDDLKSLAGMKNITLPSSPGKNQLDHIQNLSKKSGRAFDKDYMKMMVDDHKEDIDAFEKASRDASDADVKAFASNTLPVLRVHLDSAQAVLSSVK